jgi:hypothetical protein
MKISMLNYVISDGQLIRLPYLGQHFVELISIWHQKWPYKKATISELIFGH